MPVAQLSVPVRHGLGEQAAPGLHATQAPLPLHTPPSHGEPPLVGPASWQRGAPVVQLMTPFSHRLARAHGCPGAHEAQVPVPEQTPPSHGTPASTTPDAMHPGALPVHVVTPRWHELASAHGAPGVHGWQVLPTQKPPPPQRVPASATPTASHCSRPPGHETRPTLQGSAGVHAAPARHAVHMPPWHVAPPPQSAPASRGPAETQVAAPPEQSTRPLSQGLRGVQGAPGVHPAQAPPTQVPPTPHAVPAGS